MVSPTPEDLRDFAAEQDVELEGTREIAREASDRLAEKYGNSPEDIKEHFDELISETEKEAHSVYREYERQYVMRVFDLFVDHLREQGEVTSLEDVGAVLGEEYRLLDKFFMSLAQGRKSRAGDTFEYIQDSLFKRLDYPFTEKPTINGEPDFLMPSAEHFEENPMDCIIYTAKRTLRERWRQIVTEGTQGLGFFLATIDEDLTSSALEAMLDHRIYVVVPETLRSKKYEDEVNVISFSQFFEDHLDPAMRRWKRNDVF